MEELPDPLQDYYDALLQQYNEAKEEHSFVMYEMNEALQGLENENGELQYTIEDLEEKLEYIREEFDIQLPDLLEYQQHCWCRFQQD